MKKDIKEIFAEISGKVKATATRLFDKTKGLSKAALEKARELFLKAKAKISKWASVLEERLTTIAPKVDIKVKKGILIALVALIALGIAFSITQLFPFALCVRLEPSIPIRSQAPFAITSSVSISIN